MMSRRRRPYGRGPVIVTPFTAEEDEKVIEITKIGLSSHCWDTALPGRSFGEILERRLQLQELGLCPKSKVY